MVCPICGTELTVKYYDKINMGCCEYLYVCKDCKLYVEQFAYGGYETAIGNFTIHHAHNTPPDEMELINKYIRLISTAYKEKLFGGKE